ncbi:hemolysin-III family protein [Penicillium macrosclerotiorum]|uniref:hemolysin-III family protein n=1 Tax=Penicillium macrosclerotiorum TaxID=303699 RepID=UPI00254776B0|nr:hemolysin-III family protein [Penicillium macrosclerotiorum]KAJ5675560.1 hemolysin-III family protein [Penicillium macrosclerotiorum]
MVFPLRLRVPRRQSPEAHKGRGMGFTSDTASKAGKAERRVLFSFDEMPEWFRHESSQWILRGYRPISGSAHASFGSWSYIHNESVNIYSHLIPAIFFLLGEWYLQQYLTSRYSRVTGADFIAFSIFMLTAATCLSLSAIYHTLMNHSQHVEHLCLRLDMLGIVIFILGDLVLGIYMTFWCEPLPRNIYWSMVSQLRTQDRNWPLTHLVLKTRFPESQYPGKFDLWGSHSIFHILVVSAAVVQLMGYLDAFDYAQANLPCSSL